MSGSNETESNVFAALTDTLAAFSADADALRQLSSLAVHVVGTETPDESVVTRLITLDAAVSGLESKMKLLQEIVNQEQRALDDLESISEEGKRQSERLSVLLCTLQDQKVNQEDTNSASTMENLRERLQEHSSQEKFPSQDSVSLSDSTADTDTHASTAMIEPPVPTTSSKVNIQRVTQAELLSLPRPVRGRIPLSVVNEAAMDIEYVLRTKYLHRRKPAVGQPPEEEPTDQQWVSEQDLRQSCAFFRSGEGTARQTIHVLRSLNRLKQLPAKNGTVIYVCPR